MSSPSSSTASSPIPGDAYFVDLYSLVSPAHSPVHSRSPSPICAPPPLPVATGKKSIVDYDNYNHNKHIPNPNPSPKLNQNQSHSHNHSKKTIHNTAHNPHKPHRPPPYRPRLEFAPPPPPQAPYRPSLSFLPSGGTSPASISASTSASPITPESPLGGSWCENSAGQREKYAPLPFGDEERDVKGGMVSAQVRSSSRFVSCFCFCLMRVGWMGANAGGVRKSRGGRRIGLRRGRLGRGRRRG